MGNKQFKLTKLALALGLTVSLAGCFSDNDNNVDIKPPPEDKTVAVLPGDIVVEKQAGSFSIVVTDSKGVPLSDEVSATINFTGDNTASILNTAGDALTDEDKAATGGSFAFTVNEVPADGLSFDFVITADGFLSNSGTVELSSTDTDVADQVRLTARSLEQADDAAPIIATTSSLADVAGEGVTTSYTAEGGLALEGADSITLSKDLDATKNANKAAGGVSVTLNNGTKFRDKNNQELQSVPTLTVAYFGNEATRSTSEEDTVATQESSLDAFPGGLGLTVSEDETTSREGSFATGGFVAIELVDENGTKVDNFADGDIKVAMKVDKNTSNTCPMTFDGDASDAAAVKAAAEAGMFKNGVCTQAVAPRQIAVNDIFPVWSYDEDAGKWSFESYGVVKADANAEATTHNVAVSVNHLSYWNLDFFTYILDAEKCDNRRLSFDIKDSNGNDSQVYADVLVEANSYRLLIGAYNRTNLAKGTFRNPPSFPVKLKMMKDGVNILDGVTLADNTTLNLDDDGAASGVQFTNLCDLNGGTLQLTTAPATNIVKPLTPQFVCASNDADEQPTPISTPTIAQLFRGGRFVKTFYPSGQFEVSLENGDSAAYTVRYKNPNNNTWFTQAIEANTTAATLDIPVTCTVQTITGTGGS
ncbi:hypothetical protein CWB99_19525 [Pseudoalteromonas rubra]|uniref:Big-1 domain-containing protein n=1 Tax=Pseudoalteromonas rubra TaxID=43658 RepID=A0A5S3WIG2_9GAMM|nr:hypothetical protein [Pseudoalteromonas rubra]TMP26173.1 hypothetical protein CWB99_19525 [Pseudoalteromonas rubra]TMP32976.1 hypothetical protein CWC00_11505 [Pseudoalteromonas rubra]